MSYYCPKQSNQSGLVSIMVVGIIAVLITLVVLAFSRITSRDLRQSLDRQLSAQAAYAAETGLNDTVHFIQKTLKAGGAVPDEPNCQHGLNDVYPPPAGGNGAVGTSGATVTCILIQSNLDSLRVDNQTASTTKVFSITNAFEINSLKISWNGGSVTNSASPPDFPPAVGGTSWASRTSRLTAGNNPVVLRVSIIPVLATLGWNKRDDMIARARTYFLYPNYNSGAGIATAGGVSYNNLSQNGSIVPGGCNDGNATGGSSVYACNVFINGLPGGSFPGVGGSDPVFAGNLPCCGLGRGPNTGAVYYVAIRPIYNDVTSLDVDGFRTSNTENVTIQGAQALVDITARGTDVLKRIQARVNTSLSSAASQQLGEAVTPGYGIESADSICKLILIPQDGTAATFADSDPACLLKP